MLGIIPGALDFHKVILDYILAFSRNCVDYAGITTRGIREWTDFFFRNERSIVKIEDIFDIGGRTLRSGLRFSDGI